MNPIDFLVEYLIPKYTLSFLSIKIPVYTFHTKTKLFFLISERVFKIYSLKGKVYKNNQEVFLSAMEYRLLLTIATKKGDILKRDELLDSLWDIGGDFINDNTLTVYIKRLREKIEDDPQNPKLIETIRGIGYRGLKNE